ncbi:hypothetical protein Lesp02_11090 [Lentzea sp. NBRC 105346]|uniref:LPXTG cell wall anchor domain-containing protein n=1 Tax=Lentzea sp. NBRC 105346 TaxID=3032205 RepID=UPI0024A58345|nr:LPXTG cell wall anchor domain-containing protein [Lentzea sp. NBRC 105346]GLZ28919.1 hypothetical protein Lesp02_11090 [Lentzea sp. NBRC 105346]
MAGRVLGALAVAATAGLTVLAMATPALAHTPKLFAACVGEQVKVSVELRDYVDRKPNSVVVKDNGTELVKKEFGDDYKYSKSDIKGDVGHTFEIVVTAWDDPKFERGWSFKKTLEVEKCVQTPPTSSSTTTPPSETSSSVPVPSSETPAPPAGGTPAEPPLAATGASPMWTMLAGLGLVGAGAGALFLVRRKRA